MDEAKVKAIVLGGIDYKEKDMLVTLFTLERGIISVVFKGVKHPNAKLKSAKELFSFGDFIYSESKNKVIISAEILESFYEITKDIKKYYAACGIIDVIKTVIPAGEVNPQIFILVLKCLTFLMDGVDIYTVVNKFLITIFKYVGYSFNTVECNNCGTKFAWHRYMNLNYGDITCHNCRVGNFVEISQAVANTLRILSITEIDKITSIKIPKENNKQVLELLSLNFKTRFNKTLVIL